MEDLFQIILIVIYIASTILLLDLFYAEKKIEYFDWRKKNLEEKHLNPNANWATESLFWKGHRNTEYLFWAVAIIPIINTAYYLYALWYLNDSSFPGKPEITRWERIYKLRNSINSKLWFYLKKTFK